VSCHQTVKCKDVFLTVQRAFTVEHCSSPRSYLTCLNEFRDTFPDSPLPNKSTVSFLVSRFPWQRNSLLGCIKHEGKTNVRIAERRGHFQHLQ
jgi:hypothetical protein